MTLTDNIFFSGLSNLALFMHLFATNTSKEPENFVNSFMTDTLSNGDTKIFPWADLPEVTDYAEKSSLLTVTKVKTGEEYIQISQRKVIKSSFSPKILNTAFTSDTGANEFIGYLLAQMEDAKTNYLYNTIVEDLFSHVFKEAQDAKVGLYDSASAKSFTEINACDLINQKEIAKQIQLGISNIQVFNRKYNELKNAQAVSVNDLKLIMTEPFNTESVINLFATLLKSSEITDKFYKPQKHTIPTDKIPGGQEKVIGFVMHKYAYQIFYQLVFMGTFFDASNMVINNFLHFWIGKGWLKNLPVIKYTAELKTLPTAQA